MTENGESVQIVTTDTALNTNTSTISHSTTPPANGAPKFQRGSTFGQHREDIFIKLRNVADQCSVKYAGKKELATEEDEQVAELCESLEEVFSYGLKQQQAAVIVTAASIFQNMHEIVTGNIGGPCVSSILDTTFWDFCERHLTADERLRFEKLPKIWTKHGRGKAFIRAALNENSLQRYLLIWLDDATILRRYYTTWSFFLNEEAAKELPIITGSLNEVLFALAIDATELNVATRFSSTTLAREEPIIKAPAPIPVIANKHKRKTHIPIERPIATANSTENLFNSLSTSTSSESAIAVREELPQPIYENCEEITRDPIEPELEFLKQPLPDFYPVTPTAFYDIHQSTNEIEYEDKSDTSSQYSKSSSSANGVVTRVVLEQRLQDLGEHCALLETRVAQLTLENRQLLRRLTQFFKDSGIDPSSSLSSNFLITIPEAKLIKSRTGSSYYTYEVHVTMRHKLEHWSVLRRYRDFHKLHKSLLHTHPFICSVEFPPKKHFGNMNLVFVDERRQQLQIYLINLVEMLPQVEACKTKADLQKVFPFLRER